MDQHDTMHKDVKPENVLIGDDLRMLSEFAKSSSGYPYFDTFNKKAVYEKIQVSCAECKILSILITLHLAFYPDTKCMKKRK